MRTTSSIAALHRGHGMLEFVLGSDIVLRRLKFGTRHKHNVGKRGKFRRLSVFSCGCSCFKKGLHLAGTDLDTR